MRLRNTPLKILLLAAMLVLSAFPSASAEATLYRNNTVCSRGFYLRKLSDPPTDKWYMATPLDISREGTWVIDLIAGNFSVIGSAEVVVRGDELTVSCHYLDGVKLHSELLMLYKNPDEIGALEPDSLVSPYRFGESISISRDLDGQPLVLMYINNSVSFTSLVKGLKGYASLGISQIRERVAMAASIGLMEEYREEVPITIQSVSELPGSEEPDDNGCVGGVCPVPLPILPSAP